MRQLARFLAICLCAVTWQVHAKRLVDSMPKMAYAKLQGQVATFASDDCVNWGVDEVRGFVLTCVHPFRCSSAQADYTVLYRVYFGHPGSTTEVAAFCTSQNADLNNSQSCEAEPATSVGRACWNEGLDAGILIGVDRK